MSVQTSSGVTFFVFAGLPATYDDVGFFDLAWVEVGEVTDLPSIGPVVSQVNHSPLKTGIIETHKGFTDMGGGDVPMGRDIVDAGQVILKEAVIGDTKNTEHSFKFLYPDGTAEAATGKVFGYPTITGSADSIITTNATIKLNTAIVDMKIRNAYHLDGISARWSMPSMVFGSGVDFRIAFKIRSESAIPRSYIGGTFAINNSINIDQTATGLRAFYYLDSSSRGLISSNYILDGDEHTVELIITGGVASLEVDGVSVGNNNDWDVTTGADVRYIGDREGGSAAPGIGYMYDIDLNNGATQRFYAIDEGSGITARDRISGQHATLENGQEASWDEILL